MTTVKVNTVDGKEYVLTGGGDYEEIVKQAKGMAPNGLHVLFTPDTTVVFRVDAIISIEVTKE